MTRSLAQRVLLSFLTPGAVRLAPGAEKTIENQQTGDFIVVRGKEVGGVELVDSSIPGYQKADLVGREPKP
jgi:hypothetical protein